MAKKDDDIKTLSNRAVALTVLAADKQAQIGGCLRPELMADFVAGSVVGEEREKCLAHLAHCQNCYDLWKGLAIEETSSAKIIKGPWYTKRSFSMAAAGSLLAAAASVLLFINLNFSPTVMMQDEPLAPQSVEEEQPAEIVADHLDVPAAKSPSVFSMENSHSSYESDYAMEEKAKKKERLAQVARQKNRTAKKQKSAPRQMHDKRTVKDEEIAAAIGAIFEGVSDEEKKIIADPSLAALASEGEELVDIGNVVPTVVKKMAQLAEGESLILQTFKRDRSLTLIRLAGERILVKENGFSKEEFEIDVAKLKKTLKTLLKKEFPRSNTVRIVTGSSGDSGASN